MIILASLVIIVQISYLIVLLAKNRKKTELQIPSSKFNSFSGVFLPICFSFVCAAFGVQTPVFGKSVSELLRITLFRNDNQFKFWFTYVLIALFFFFAIIWLVRLNIALKKYDALYIVPVIGCKFSYLKKKKRN